MPIWRQEPQSVYRVNLAGQKSNDHDRSRSSKNDRMIHNEREGLNVYYSTKIFEDLGFEPAKPAI